MSTTNENIHAVRLIEATRNDPGNGDARNRAIDTVSDLLAACKAALERIDGMNEAMGVIDELRAAIAKAEGAER